MLKPEQSRAARALIKWTQQDLENASGVSLSAIKTFEDGSRSPISRNLEAIENALISAGVEFIPENGGGPGVRLVERKA